MEKNELEMAHADRIAWRKAGSIPGWEVCGWELVDMDAKESDLIMKGGIPRFLSSGKYKGNKTWRDSKISKVVVTAAEVRAEKESYIAITGNCPTCMGKSEVMQSWSSTEGIKMRPCKPCNATGKHLEAA